MAGRSSKSSTARQQRIRSAKKTISRLVGQGVKMNFSKASDFTQQEAERARRKRFAGRGRG